MIVLTLCVLAGLLVTGVAVDALRWFTRREAQRSYEREHHGALMREIRRQP